MIKRRINYVIRKLRAYKNYTYYITRGSRISEEFQMIKGPIQGGVLSLNVFNILMDEIIKECETKMKKIIAMYNIL